VCLFAWKISSPVVMLMRAGLTGQKIVEILGCLRAGSRRRINLIRKAGLAARLEGNSFRGPAVMGIADLWLVVITVSAVIYDR